MKKLISSQESKVREYVRQFQTNQDKEALNYLLEKYYSNSCKYASKFLNNKVYSNMVSWTFEEIESYVFIAFWKALHSYKLESESSLSFKNYLYQLIKFETLKEIKHNFNWQCIPKAEQKWYREDNAIVQKDSLDICNSLEFKSKVQTVYRFLLGKKKEYADIWELKRQQLKNSEICEKLGLTEAELKSRWQYIKKLILSRYSSLERIF